MTRRTLFSRILGSLLLILPSQPLFAQALEFEGSIFALDPPALQSTELEQMIGGDETTPLNQFAEGDFYRALGRPVGRLAIQLLNGKSAFCTASMIDETLLLTNAHCVLDSKGNPVANAALLTMGYLTAGVSEGSQQYIVDIANPVEIGFPGTEGAPDYAILRVTAGEPGRDWGTVKLASAGPRDRSSLIIIHHPLGFPKVLSAGGNCRSERSTDDDVFHICDTQPGSSGAPVLAPGRNEVVALHYRKAGVSENAAVRIDRLLQASPVLAALTAQPVVQPDPQPEEPTVQDTEPEAEPAPQVTAPTSSNVASQVTAPTGSNIAPQVMAIPSVQPETKPQPQPETTRTDSWRISDGTNPEAEFMRYRDDGSVLVRVAVGVDFAEDYYYLAIQALTDDPIVHFMDAYVEMSDEDDRRPLSVGRCQGNSCITDYTAPNGATGTQLLIPLRWDIQSDTFDALGAGSTLVFLFQTSDTVKDNQFLRSKFSLKGSRKALAELELLINE